MLNVIIWLLAAQVIGLAVFPLTYYLFPRFKDRGFSLAMPLGILIVGYLSWLLSVLHILPSVQLTVLGILLVVGGLSVWFTWSHRQEMMEFVVRERTILIATEAVFLLVFLGWVVYRAYDPFINNTEQPMDFAFLNATIRSTIGQPEDPWLRGEGISYYYFGYWMMGVLSKLTAIPSFISYNLSLALIPALGAMGIFGLVVNMVRADSGRLRVALVAGVVAASLLVLAANLEGVLEFMRANGMGSSAFWDGIGIDGLNAEFPVQTDSWRPQEFMWWWRATRVIGSYQDGGLLDYTIQEFPFFSYILGDLHPHVMSVPFVVLFLAMCWNFLRSPALSFPQERERWREWVQPAAMIGSMGLVLGGLAFTNMWDLPVFGAVLVGVVALKTYSTHGAGLLPQIKNTLPTSLAVIGIALILVLPYLTSFTSQVSGIGAVGANTTHLPQLIIVWALFLMAVIPFALVAFWKTTVDHDWARATGVSLAIGFLPYVVWAFIHLEGGGETSDLAARLIHVLPFALLTTVAVYSATWFAKQEDPPTGLVFALLLAALGLLLIMGPELLYVDDSFGGAYERMNTMFKLYYQGWIVLATAAGYAIYYWRSIVERTSGSRHALTRVWAAAFIVLLAGAAYYPLAAAATKGGLFDGDANLDGLSHLSAAPRNAIDFLRDEADDDSAVLEAFGGDYTEFGQVSASTGVPTILGWIGHELQWRGSSEPMDGREADIATIYTTPDADEAKNLLASYNVDYVYIGPREREKYGEDGLIKFSDFMEAVFTEGDVTIYRLTR
jgi:YYY domain-containing protein